MYKSNLYILKEQITLFYYFKYNEKEMITSRILKSRKSRILSVLRKSKRLV